MRKKKKTRINQSPQVGGAIENREVSMSEPIPGQGEAGLEFSTENRLTVDDIINLNQTNEGQDACAALAVDFGQTIALSHVEMALHHYERTCNRGSVRSVCGRFSLPEQTLTAAMERIEQYEEQYKEAKEEYWAYTQDVKKGDQELIENAKKDKYYIEPESAKRAEEEEDFDLAYAIYRNLPRADKWLIEKFGDVSALGWEALGEQLLNQWARDTKNQGLLESAEARVDNGAYWFDKMSYETRRIQGNYAPEYYSIGDYEEAEKRMEGDWDNLAKLDTQSKLSEESRDRFGKISLAKHKWMTEFYDYMKKKDIKSPHAALMQKIKELQSP